MLKHRHLRLVTAGFGRGIHSPSQTRETVFSLSSVNLSSPHLHGEIMMDVLLSLSGLATVAFEHSLTGREGDFQTGHCDLKVRLVSEANQHDAFVKRIATGLRLACPAFHFENTAAQVGHTNANGLKSQSPSHAWDIRLAPVVLKARGEAGARRFDTTPESVFLPYPTVLTSGSLDLDLICGQAEFRNLKIVLRASAMVLSQSQCADFEKLKHRLEAGAMRAFHPDSPFKHEFAANTRLLDESSNLLGAWLRHPDRGLGWTLSLESDDMLSIREIESIASVVLGDRPVQVAKVHPDRLSSPQALTLVDGTKPGQGLPNLLAAATLLKKMGVAEHFSPPPIRPPESDGVVVGKTVCGHSSTTVALPEADRYSHVGVFGASGSGKSTFLLGLIEKTLANPKAPRLGLIDPHGNLYNDVLKIIPRKRLADVVLVDVTDPSFVSSINPLEGMAEDRQYASFIANEIVALIDVLFEEKGTSGPVLRSHIRNALLLSSCVPGRSASFIDASRLFDDKDFRDHLLSQCKNAKMHSYWRDFIATNGENGFKNWLPYIQARFSPFCDSPLMRRMLNAPHSRIDIDRCVAEGKIVLFNLSTALLGSTEARIFGNLMLNRIFYAAMRRTTRASVEPKPFHLVVDEAASMVSASTTRLWAEARKFGLSLTTASQSISQMRSRAGDNDIAQALLSNTATKVFFRLSPADASMLEPYAAPEFTAKGLTRMPVLHCALSLSAYGQILPAFVCKVERPVVDPIRHALPSKVREASCLTSSTPIAETAEQLSLTYDLPVESFLTTNDEQSVQQHADLFAAAGIPQVIDSSEQFDRFAKLLDDAMTLVMGSLWTMNVGNIKERAHFAKYFDPESAVQPDYRTVVESIEADVAMSQPSRLLILQALDIVRPRFWPESEPEEESINA